MRLPLPARSRAGRAGLPSHAPLLALLPRILLRVLPLAAPLLLGALLAGAGCSERDDPPPRTSAAPLIEPPPRREAPATEVPWRGEGALVEMSVWEMHCDGCERAVEDALGAVEGVVSVEADHETSIVRVRLADAAGRDAAIPRLGDAIRAGGRRVLGEDPPAPAR